MLLGQDPLDHERLWRTIYRKLQSVGRAGLVTQAQAAVDLALWDIKGKAANQPVWKLLGGMRADAPVYGSDGGWLYMSVDEMMAEFESYRSQGMFGVKMKIGHADPEIDIERVAEVRRRLGDGVWLAVDANQQWDYERAVRAGRAFEKLGVAWLEEPLICEDIVGHARLVQTLDIPIALGETLASRFEFASYIRENAVDTLQPDVIRAGGITECAKIVHLAEINGRAVAFHHVMEVSIHLVCGLLADGPIEYMPWIAAAFRRRPGNQGRPHDRAIGSGARPLHPRRGDRRTPGRVNARRRCEKQAAPSGFTDTIIADGTGPDFVDGSCRRLHAFLTGPGLSKFQFAGPCDPGSPSPREFSWRAVGFPGSHGPGGDDGMSGLRERYYSGGQM